MQSAPAITWRNLDSSPSLEGLVHDRIAELDGLDPRIVSCDVVIEAPQKRRASGREIAVLLKVAVPGPDIVVERRVARSSAGEDAVLAVNRAFDAARQMLIERKRRQGDGS